MTDKDRRSGHDAEMRKQAEAMLWKQDATSSPAGEALSPEELRQTLHELRVHEIELEMQNEELRRAQVELDAARARYFDLYDLAPVGYCTLSEQGLILEANLTVGTLLGVSRSELSKQPFSRFIFKADQDIYYLHRKRLFEAHSAGSGQTAEPQECELRLARPDGVLFWAHLTGTVAQAEDGAPLCRVVLSDVTERKRAEQQIHGFSHQLLATRESERKRLAAALHHDLGSLVVSVSGRLNAVEEAILAGGYHEAVDHVRSCHGALRSSVERLKAITVSLRPPDLDVLGLTAALRQHIARVSEDTGLKIRFLDTLGGCSVDDATAIVLFRIGQEALTNVARHAGATNVTVRLSAWRAVVTLSVCDNGCGFDASHLFSLRTEAMGITSMREMAASLGGETTIESRPEKGTKITVTLPLDATNGEPGEP
jgi:PAS domain S-box-containing protein